MDDAVRDFLWSMVPPGTRLADLRAEADRWEGSGDLNENWIAHVRLAAGMLLHREGLL